MKLFRKNKKSVVYAPVNGKCIALEDVADEMFSQKMLGEGVAFIPESSQICAPCDCIILMIAKTKHAFGIRTEEGIEILVHIGLDTVNLNGKGFDVLVSEGDKVSKGTPIVEMNLLGMKGMDLTTPMIVTGVCHYDFSKLPINQKVVCAETVIFKE